MLKFNQIDALRQHLESQRLTAKRIGFVPTMGALHQGHLSLIANARQENDVVVCSIFVNPTQFNNQEDFDQYPRILKEDEELLKANGCDVLFAPDAQEMYPEKPLIKFEFGELERVMEGAHRPGHFSGVGLVVSKLFHIVQPHRAYFGEKDYQQLCIIRQMVTQLNFPLEVIGVPIVREADGLAMSSRNKRLSAEERQQALIFSKVLREAQAALLNKQSVQEVKEWLAKTFEAAPEGVQLEYFEIAHRNTLASISVIEDPNDVILCIAGFVGNVRLIDNMFLIS